MFPSTPPAANLSRSRLKALAKWVRDELDLLVAREGPNVLRPDDVLILHETLIALRHATDITALDLRATGIHRAVLDIAGVATRWPSRLCDDCDKIISIWTARFGPLKELHPFLFGRGGRLEGIASVTEYSREALLKRWSKNCPDKLRSSRSHRLGNLGFRPGDWWINTLFAYHAGIIGLEAVEGGTTFDKHGAYALVLKDTGELEASSGSAFTYRVPQWDTGKFRLTAATPQSRDPIRVLRCHSINSVWGPKAGVRYEGLYGVRGWSICQAKSADAAGGHWKEGDILFDVQFERSDQVPLSEILERPTATEVDDYAEYKRLRKLHREGKSKPSGLTIDLSELNAQVPSKAVPPIVSLPVPLQSVMVGEAQKTPHRGSPPAPQKAMFKRPHFDLAEENTGEQDDLVSPTSTRDTDYFVLPPRRGSMLVVPRQTSRRPNYLGGDESSPQGSPTDRSPVTNSGASSEHTGASMQSKIGEVAPWIDVDAGLSQPPPSESPTILHRGSVSQPLSKSSMKKTGVTRHTQRHKFRLPQESPPIALRRERRKSGDFKGMTGVLSPGSSHKSKESRKATFARSLNPIAKLLDGADSLDCDDDNNNYFRNARFDPTMSFSGPRQTTPPRRRATSSDSAVRVHSPVPLRPFSPLALGPRGGMYTSDDSGCAASPLDDPFVELPSPRFPLSLPKVVSEPKVAMTMGCGEFEPGHARVESDGAEQRLRKTMDSGDRKGTLKNPFGGSPAARKKGG